jgi:uncharacterized protein (UPF0276 family)
MRRERSPLSWLEAHAENFMAGGMLAEDLDDLRRDYPLSLHAVGLSLGSASGVNGRHLRRLQALTKRYEPFLVSDHLSWSEVGGVHLPDLLPLPYTEEALRIVASNVDQVQQVLGRPVLMENPSVYAAFAYSPIPEPEFLAELAARTQCGLLLDINNIAVSARNLGRAPSADLYAFLSAVRPHAVHEIHLAGHAVTVTRSGAQLRIDDHGSAVSTEVWRLFARAIDRLGPRPTLIEWDTNIPALDVLAVEAAKAQQILDAAANREAEHARAL